MTRKEDLGANQEEVRVHLNKLEKDGEQTVGRNKHGGEPAIRQEGRQEGATPLARPATGKGKT